MAWREGLRREVERSGYGGDGFKRGHRRMGRGWIGWWEGGGGVVVRAGRGEDGRGRRRGGRGGGGGAVEEVAVRERDAIVGEWVSRKCGWLVAL